MQVPGRRADRDGAAAGAGERALRALPAPFAIERPGMELVEIFVTLGFWAALVRMATPLIFGTLGELICERAGVLNLGIEGIMTMGAMVAWMWVYQGGDLWTAVLVAAAAGAPFGLLPASFSTTPGAPPPAHR